MRKSTLPFEVREYLILHKNDFADELCLALKEKFNIDKTPAALYSWYHRNSIRSAKHKKLRKKPLLNKEQNRYFLENLDKYTCKEITDAMNKKFNLSLTMFQLKYWSKKNNVKRKSDGRFKKGNLPSNTLPIGTELKTKDGYIVVKIDNPDVWVKKSYVPFLNEDLRGKMVTYLDGNKDNLEKDNLALVTRAESLALTKNNYRDADKEYTRLGLNLIRLNKALKDIENARTR